MSAWTLDTQIDVTPLGRYVSRLHTADQRLDALSYPGLHSPDGRVQKQAQEAFSAANGLRGVLHEELARFGGLPLGTGHDEVDAYGYPLDYDGPTDPR